MELSQLEEIKHTIEILKNQPNVSILTPEEIKQKAEQFGTKTKYGNCNYVSTVKTVSTALTVYLGSDKIEAGAYTQKKRDIKKAAPETIRLVHEYLKKANLVRIGCTMGNRSDFTPHCTLYISLYRKEMIRLAHMVAETLFPASADGSPELTVICIPEWQEKDRQILVFPEIGVTYILGSNYYGEAKNALLRMAVWSAKQRGMLGLHAATKILHAKRCDGTIRKLGMIMFGIAATGKTTHSCHNHGLNEQGERVEIVQDDVVFWKNDGSALGSERGFYIKTEGLASEIQPLLHHAALQKEAILDNVMVDYEGNIYFEDKTLTPNGRGIIQRESLGPYMSESVNLPPIDELDGLIMAFMVRNYTVLPIVSKLTPEQATVAYMLSESIDASASDQQKPGMLAGGIGASPFIIGDASEECNRFYELLKAHSDKIECYMLNTGGIGELVEHGLDGARRVKQKVTRVEIPEMATIIRGIARGTIEWREDPNWMVETPIYVDDLDISKFELRAHYNQAKIDSLIAAIRLERTKYAEQFKGLHPAVRSTTEF